MTGAFSSPGQPLPKAPLGLDLDHDAPSKLQDWIHHPVLSSVICLGIAHSGILQSANRLLGMFFRHLGGKV